MDAIDKINNRRGLKNVLVVRFSAITDVVLTIPVVYSACHCYNKVNFYIVTCNSMTSLFVNAPRNLSVIGVDIENEYRGALGMRRLLNNLRGKYKIDAIVDLQNNFNSLLLRLWGKLHNIHSASINKAQNGAKALIRRNNKLMLPITSMIARYREAFFRLELPVHEQFDGLYGKGRANIDVFAQITSPKSGDEMWIGIAPFAKHRGKVYPLQLMEKVIADLSQITHAKIFLFGGGEDEQKILNEWENKYERVVSLADKKHGFPVEMALMSHLDVMVAMDSANMHLASLVGATVVSIWGATHSYCGFKAWRQIENNMIQLPMTCRPCSLFGNKPCRRSDYYCLAGIPSQVIIDKVREIILKEN